MKCPSYFTPGKDLVPTIQEAGWALGSVWMGMENLAPLGFKAQTAELTVSHYANYATINTPVLASVIKILA
jgi:hypothetical protein